MKDFLLSGGIYVDFNDEIYVKRLELFVRLATAQPHLFWKTKRDEHRELLEGEFILGTHAIGEGTSRRSNIRVPIEYWDMFPKVREVKRSYTVRNLVPLQDYRNHYEALKKVQPNMPIPNAFVYTE